ncbi:MAG: glycosyltransferase [Gammaproteobacteria bacterium]|jgi:glycosyltransferase involved in cell wall biosynthesis
MKILHIITGLAAGGAERTLHNLLSGGLAREISSAVVSLGDSGVYGQRIESLGVPVHALGMSRGLPSLQAVVKLRRIVRQYGPSLIQGWMYHGNIASWQAYRFAGYRPAFAWNIRQSLYSFSAEKYFTRWIIRANRRLSHVPSALLYNSTLSRSHHEAFGFHSAAGLVIPNGFDLMRWRPALPGERSLVRKSLGIPEGATVVGHVARLHPMKDHACFLRAISRLLEKHPTVHIILVGAGVAGENLALKPYLPKSTLMERVHLLGERHDIAKIMRSFDVLAQSSWSEAFPNVLGEAMASGVPCVATEVGDSAQIIGDTGILVPPCSDIKLFEALHRMIRFSVEERRCRGDAARARIKLHFSLPVVVDRYAALYHSLCQGVRL